MFWNIALDMKIEPTTLRLPGLYLRNLDTGINKK